MSKRESTGPGMTAAKRFRGWSRQARLAIALGAYAVYALAFFLIHPLLGTQTAILATAPVIVVAGFFGLRGGLLGAVVAFPLNPMLSFLTGEDLSTWLREGGVSHRD